MVLRMSVAKLGDRRRLFELFTALRDKSQLATKTGVYTRVSLSVATPTSDETGLDGRWLVGRNNQRDES